MKKILSLFVFLAIFLASPSKIFAASNFSTYYNVTYNAGSDETTKVVMDVELKNSTSDYYASSYTIQTGYQDLKNILVSDTGGNLTYNAVKNNKGTAINFSFNEKVVGINNSQRFTVNFETKEIAKNYGSIWEVNIPGVSNQEEYQEFNVTVNVPNEFGFAEIIKPQIKDVSKSGSSLTFTKESLGESGISIAYGANQIYSFNLKYHLRNRNIYPVTSEIAIPSNNNYQQITINDIIPRPLNVVIDNDGNWLAKYKLLPSDSIDVLVKGVAKVSYKPSKEVLSKERRELYLKPLKYWESDNSEIKRLAKELKTPDKIYKYVVDSLKYDSGRVKEVQVRAGGAGVLMNKNSAVCLEFTDLFVALARSAGIPARAVEGYANTSNSLDRPLSLFKDVLHSWPQFYDDERQTWIMVDPTWENTTEGIDYFNVFDFDHLAFVIKGEDSEYPVPAGGYKIPGKKSTQDVQVTTSKGELKVLPTLNASTNFSEKYVGGLPIKGEIIVINNSGVISPNQTIKLSSNILSPSSQNLFLEGIPPFGKRSIPVAFNPRPFLTNEKDTIKITIGSHTLTEQVAISPFYKNTFLIVLGGILIGSFCAILSAVTYKRRRLSIP